MTGDTLIDAAHVFVEAILNEARCPFKPTADGERIKFSKAEYRDIVELLRRLDTAPDARLRILLAHGTAAIAATINHQETTS